MLPLTTYTTLEQELILILSKRFSIHPFSKVSPEHSAVSKTSSKVLQLQQLPGWVRQEELTTVATIFALLWHQLMGRNVLSTGFTRTEKIRSYSYTHCAKQSKGITLLLINLDNSTTVQAKLTFNITFTLRDMHRSRIWHHKHKIHRTTIIKLPKRITAKITREECHLTAKDGNLQSQTMLLNGKVLSVNSSGSEPIMVAPLSIVFVHMPGVIVPACKVQS
ncbi:hypothetical protein V6N13_107820 [Hibiscus sabdariffa]